MNIIRPLLVLSLLLPGLAAAQTGDESLDRIRTLAAAAIRAQAAPGAQVAADTLDPRLRLPACATPPSAEAPAAIRGSSVSVAVRCDAPMQWTVHVPVRVRDLRQVLVLSRAVRAGEAVDAKQFSLQERDVTALPFGHLEDPAGIAGQQFRRALPAGSALAPADLAAPDWVKRGQMVQLVSRAGAIEVRAEGKALANGAAGQRVRVENRGSRQVVEGVVRAPGVIEVAL